MIVIITSNNQLKVFNEKGTLFWDMLLPKNFTKSKIQFKNRSINFISSKSVKNDFILLIFLVLCLESFRWK